MLVWVEQDEMKKRQEQKSDFSRIVMTLVNGIQKISVQSFGICSMVKSVWEKTSSVPYFKLDRDGRLAIYTSREYCYS